MTTDLPHGWEAKSMLRLSKQIFDYRGRTPKKLGMDWGGGDIPALSAGNVKMGFIDWSAECYFGSEDLYRKWMTQGCPSKDDILFTTEAPLGNVALVPDDRRYILSQRTILLQIDPLQARSKFVAQMMSSEAFQRMLADYSSGSTAKGIQRRKFERLEIAVPPLDEQESIETVLSDVDALLAALDRLIAKKRDLKQAAMQQLLTGKVRLSGFRSAWKVRRLDELGAWRGGMTPSMQNPMYWDGGTVPWISSGDVKALHLDATAQCVTAHAVKQNAAIVVPSGSIVLVTRSGILRKYLPVALLSRSMAINQDVKALRPLGEYSAAFLLQSLIWNGDRILASCMKAGTTVESVEFGWLKAFTISLPDLPEQAAIAKVLGELDAELVQLDARRDKIHALKQAMMQALLTGRIRLI